MDEIWSFVGKKDRNVRVDEDGVGSVWTFCAIDAETKLVPAFKVGNCDVATASEFVQDVASRMKNRVQISTDGLRAYVEAIERPWVRVLTMRKLSKLGNYRQSPVQCTRIRFLRKEGGLRQPGQSP